jgi:hypothetical protein
MKQTLSSIVAVTNLLLSAVTVGLVWLLLPRFDPFSGSMRAFQGVELAWVSLAILLLVGLPLVTLVLALFDAWRGLRRRALLSATIASALLSVPLSWLSLGDWLATRQEQRAERAWAETLEPMDAFLSRYPEAPASENARQLRVLAARLGIDLDPSDLGDTPRAVQPAGYPAIRKSVASYLSSQTSKPDGPYGAPPPEVLAWLSSNDADLVALVAALRSGGPIVFATDWRAVRRPIPNLLGMRDSVSVLLVRALDRERSGDSTAANEALEASWQLGGAVRDRGDVICQSVAVGVDGMTLAALRKLHAAPHAWRTRIAEHDYRASMRRAFEGESWTFSASVNGWTPDAELERRRRRGLLSRIDYPLLRLMAADTSLALTRMVVELKAINPCQADIKALDEWAGSPSRWNLFGKEEIGGLATGWSSAARMALQVELTQKVLAARELRNARGAWPSELPGLESSVCPGTRWAYSTSGDGGMSLSLPAIPSLGPALAFRAEVK